MGLASTLLCYFGRHLSLWPRTSSIFGLSRSGFTSQIRSRFTGTRTIATKACIISWRRKWRRQGLLNAERNGTSIAVQGLTARGRKLIDASSNLSTEFLNDIHKALYQEIPYNDDPSSGVNRFLNSE